MKLDNKVNYSFFTFKKGSLNFRCLRTLIEYVCYLALLITSFLALDLEHGS